MGPRFFPCLALIPAFFAPVPIRALRSAWLVRLPRSDGGRSPTPAVGPVRSGARLGERNQEGGLYKPRRAAEAGAGETNQYYVQTTSVGLPH